MVLKGIFGGASHFGMPSECPGRGHDRQFFDCAVRGKQESADHRPGDRFGDIIFFLGALGHSVFQISVSVAPGNRAMTRMPSGRSSSRSVL